MHFYSTGRISPCISFREAVAKSEAPDGGLYMPEYIPVVPKAFLNNISGMTMQDIAFVINSMFIGCDLSPIQLKNICNEVFSLPIPIHEIEPGIFIMEMFHGPTKTVKDFGASFLTHIMKNLFFGKSSQRVMVATTGFSGAAIARGFHDVGGIEVFVLYPRGTSNYHLELINPLGDNIHAIEVNGTIEDCKNLISCAFEDSDLNSMSNYTSANSTNIGYLLPYISLFFYAYSKVKNKMGKLPNLDISIPSGNCGCLLAAYIAKKMGLPVNGLIAACNDKIGFHNFLNTGAIQKNTEKKSSYAYGIGSPYPGNLPRFYALCHGDISTLRTDINSGVCTNDEITKTINDVYERCGYLLDPHSAVAYKCLKEKRSDNSLGLLLASAHPIRSIEAMRKINNGKLKLPYVMKQSLCYRPEATIPPSFPAFKKYLSYLKCSNLVQNRS